MPISHATQLYTPDYGLCLDHTPIGTEAVVQPAEARRVLALIDRFPALAVILERPHFRPQFAVIGSDHAALAASAHDLVLAERPGTDMADGTD
ncbi:hypothetical protein D3C78_1401140 [compost metagenome]